MKLLVLILSLSAFNAYACSYELKVKIKPIVNLSLTDLQELRVNFITKMEKLGYFNDGKSSQISLFYTTSNDIYNPRLTQARVALSYKKAGRLENYTYGLGSPNRNRHDATIVEEFQVALNTAISQLPHCK